MRKVCIAFLMIFSLLAGSVSVFASPDTVAPDASGNSSSLVVVTKPKNQKDSTFDTVYIISGYGKEGTTVTLYSYSQEDGVYKKLYNETQYVDENGVTQKSQAEAEVKIGASGLFMSPVTLTQGGNDLLIRAVNGETVQLMKLSLTKYSYNLFDIIKSLTD